MFEEGFRPEMAFPKQEADLFQEAASKFARYLEFENPEGVVEQGLNDEVIELLEQACGDEYWTAQTDVPENPLPLEDLREELGDLLWYLSQVLKLRGSKLSQYISAETWDQNDPDQNPLLSSYMVEELVESDDTHGFKVKPATCISILNARLLDSLHPSKQINEADIDQAFLNLLSGIGIAGNLRGLSLREIAQANLEKLAARPREPHTIGHVRDGEPSLTRRKQDLWLNSQRGVRDPETSSG